MTCFSPAFFVECKLAVSVYLPVLNSPEKPIALFY